MVPRRCCLINNNVARNSRNRGRYAAAKITRIAKCDGELYCTIKMVLLLFRICGKGHALSGRTSCRISHFDITLMFTTHQYRFIASQKWTLPILGFRQRSLMALNDRFLGEFSAIKSGTREPPLPHQIRSLGEIRTTTCVWQAHLA